MQDEEETTEESPEDTATPEPESAPEEPSGDDDVPPDPEPVPEEDVAEAQADGDPAPVETFNPPSFAEHQAAKQAALRAQRNG